MPNYYLLHNYSGDLRCIVPEDEVRTVLTEALSNVPAIERQPMMDALSELMRHWGDLSATGSNSVLDKPVEELLSYLELEIDRVAFDWMNPESEVGSEVSLRDVGMPAGWWAAVAQTLEGWLWEIGDFRDEPLIVAYDSTPYPTREDAMDEVESWVVGYLNATRYKGSVTR